MSGLVALHYKSYGTFLLYSKRLHNLREEFTHYRNYRALKARKLQLAFFIGKKSIFLKISLSMHIVHMLFSKIIE